MTGRIISANFLLMFIMDIEMQSLITFCIRSVVRSYSHFYRLNIHVLFHMRRFVDMRGIRIQVPLLHLLTMRLIRQI